jgi:hypothetical protein
MPVIPSNPAVPPDRAAIDVLQYSTMFALFLTASSLYATISVNERCQMMDSVCAEPEQQTYKNVKLHPKTEDKSSQN